MNPYQLARMNGELIEKKICDRFQLTYVNDVHDAEKDGVKYEIKSCQIEIGKTHKRKGRFILDEKDIELMKENAVFIFVVHDGQGKILRCAFVHGKKLLSEMNIKKILSWRSLMLHVEKVYYDL
ncbi:MAG: hypothetical protein ACP5IC_02510 [Minisyncoccia bacterium]